MKSASEVESTKRNAAPTQDALAQQRAQFQKVVDEANAALRKLREDYAAELAAHEVTRNELDNLKKGSIAMMKYVTNLQRKKHDEELEFLKGEAREGKTTAGDLEDQVEVLLKELKAARKGAAPSTAEWAAREAALSRREAAMVVEKRRVDEQFLRLKDERELKRAEAGSKFEQEMGRLPEMQKLVIERDDTIKALKMELQKRDEDIYFKLAAAMAELQEGEQVDPRFSRETAEGIGTQLVRLRHELAVREEKIKRMSSDHEQALRNVVRLERIRAQDDAKDVPRKGKARKGLLRRP